LGTAGQQAQIGKGYPANRETPGTRNRSSSLKPIHPEHGTSAHSKGSVAFIKHHITALDANAPALPQAAVTQLA